MVALQDSTDRSKLVLETEIQGNDDSIRYEMMQKQEQTEKTGHKIRVS